MTMKIKKNFKIQKFKEICKPWSKGTRAKV